jgi:hypothetical protein
MKTHGNTMMKVPMPVTTMVAKAAVVLMQGSEGYIRLWALTKGWWWSIVAMTNITSGLWQSGKHLLSLRNT